jgi:hypothetical protein
VRDHLRAMTEPRPSHVLGGLPRSRPHRRSQRRPAVQPIPAPAATQTTTPEESTGKAALQMTKTNAGAANPAARATAGAANPAARATAGAANPAARATASAAKPQAGTSAAKRKTRAATVARPSSQIAPTGRATTTSEAAHAGDAARAGEAAPTGAEPTTAMPPLTPPVTPGAKATRTDVLGTAVQAAAELAEIGLTVGARTLRNTLSRLPHP